MIKRLGAYLRPYAIILIIISLMNCIAVNAQEEPDYFIADTESGQYLVYGSRFLISVPDEACYEIIEDVFISKGKKFIIMHIKDEMENDRGVIIFNKDGSVKVVTKN